MSVNGWWIVPYLGSLGSAWPPVKQKSSANVVCWNIEAMEGGGVVWDSSLANLKGC